jgi:hypothetical protein
MVPAAVLADCRKQAEQLNEKPRNWVAAAVIVAVWLLLAGGAVFWVLGRVTDD